MKDHYNVLFVCTENAARSQMAEALLNQIGHGVFHAYSAGSRPSGVVHPMALAALAHVGINTTKLRSKSWDEFAHADAPQMDLVLTLCDDAAGEVCPPWPGVPTLIHWSMPHLADDGDPAECLHRFNQALIFLRHRLDLLVSLPFEKIDRLAWKQHINQIGHSAGA